MAKGLSGRMLIEHRDEAGVSVFTSKAWRRMLDIRGPLVHELILEFFSMFRFGQAILDLDTPSTLQFQLGRARGYIFLAWVAMGPEWQLVAATGTPAVAEDALIIDEGGQADPTPKQAPQQSPPPPPAHARTMPQRMARLEEDVQYMGYHWLRMDDGQDRSCLYAICSDLCIIPKVRQTEDWRGQHLRSSAGPVAARPMILPIFIFCLYLTKPDRPREGNIDEYWWRIYEYGNLEVLES
ncbi:hypothetical protein Tco_1547513 [Tanacetum coccineum]